MEGVSTINAQAYYMSLILALIAFMIHIFPREALHDQNHQIPRRYVFSKMPDVVIDFCSVRSQDWSPVYHDLFKYNFNIENGISSSKIGVEPTF